MTCTLGLSRVSFGKGQKKGEASNDFRNDCQLQTWRGRQQRPKEALLKGNAKVLSSSAIAVGFATQRLS